MVLARASGFLSNKRSEGQNNNRGTENTRNKNKQLVKNVSIPVTRSTSHATSHAKRSSNMTRVFDPSRGYLNAHSQAKNVNERYSKINKPGLNLITSKNTSHPLDYQPKRNNNNRRQKSPSIPAGGENEWRNPKNSLCGNSKGQNPPRGKIVKNQTEISELTVFGVRIHKILDPFHGHEYAMKIDDYIDENIYRTQESHVVPKIYLFWGFFVRFDIGCQIRIIYIYFVFYLILTFITKTSNS